MAKKDKVDTSVTTEAPRRAPSNPIDLRIKVLEAQVKKLAYTMRKHFSRGKTSLLLAFCLLIPIASIGFDY